MGRPAASISKRSWNLFRSEVGKPFAGGDQLRPDIEDSRVGTQGFRLDFRGVGKIPNRCLDGVKSGNAAEVGNHGIGDTVDVAHALADLDITILVELLDRHRKGAEGLAPEFVDAFLATAVKDDMPKVHRIEQALATFAHQRVVTVDLDAVRLQLHQPPEDIGGAIEQGAGEHRGLDPTPTRVVLRLITLPGFAEAASRNIESVLGVVEQTPGQRFDQQLLGLQGITGNRIRLDPVAIVEHTLLIIDDPPRSLGRRRVVSRGPFESVDIVHRCNLCRKTS